MGFTRGVQHVNESGFRLDLRAINEIRHMKLFNLIRFYHKNNNNILVF